MTREERESLYEGLFARQYEHLHLLEWPELHRTYPQFARKINAAYLRHTTFIVKVWINYDAVAHRFYWDDRAQDCGHIRVLNKELVDRLHFTQHAFSKVRFEVCTPFTLLATMKLVVEPTGLKGAPCLRVLRGVRDEDSVLAEGLSLISRRIKAQIEPKALAFEDLETIAKIFRLEPAEEDLTYSAWLRDTRMWMNFRRDVEGNQGYVSGLGD